MNEDSSNHTPVHIGIIPDGNRRWARERNLPTIEGHRKGYNAVREVVKAAFDMDVKYVSVYIFSTENWQRSKEEVSGIMGILKWVLLKEVPKFNKDGVRLRFMGERNRLPIQLTRLMENAEKLTADNKNGTVILCIDYNGQGEITHAIRQILGKGIGADDVSSTVIEQNLYLSDVPAPDIIVRTSGEQRLSGFLTWQSAYSEFVFVDKFWPEFDKNDMQEVIEIYQSRKRRFGK